jgi:vacuolar-type H+-ATPase subunit H
MEIMEEHRKTMRKLVEDYKSTIRQVVEEEKVEIWKKAETLKKAMLKLRLSSPTSQSEKTGI